MAPGVSGAVGGPWSDRGPAAARVPVGCSGHRWSDSPRPPPLAPPRCPSPDSSIRALEITSRPIIACRKAWAVPQSEDFGVAGAVGPVCPWAAAALQEMQPHPFAAASASPGASCTAQEHPALYGSILHHTGASHVAQEHPALHRTIPYHTGASCVAQDRPVLHRTILCS